MKSNSFRISINSLNPKLNDFFGKRALLAPEMLRSYLLHKEPTLKIILNEFFYEETNDVIVSNVLSQHADLISFSTYIWNIERIIAICYKIKQKRDTLIILGGPQASITANEILSKHRCIDIVVIGEGEEILYRLVQKIKSKSFNFHEIPNLAFRNKTQVIKTEIADVFWLEEQNNLLDTSAWHECDRICYETSRGCLMKCNFCLWYKGLRGKMHFFSMAKVKADLNNIFKLPRLKILEFVDADINMNKKRAFEIFQYVRLLNDIREKEGMVRVYVLYETDPEFLSDKIIQEMSKHDRIMDFGLQTIDETVNNNLNRMFHKEKYFQNLEKMVTIPSDRTGDYMLEIIYGLPGDTLQGFKNTINFILSLPYMINFWSFRFLILPGTFIRKESERFGIVYSSEPPYNLLHSNTWSENDLKTAQTLSFYFFFVQYGLPEVFKIVKESETPNKLAAFEAIFDQISKNYKEILELRCGIGEETYQFQVCSSFSSDPLYDNLKRALIKDSKSILKSLI